MRKGRPRSSAVHICPNGRILSHPQAYLFERETSAHIHVRKGGSAGEMEHHKTTCRNGLSIPGSIYDSYVACGGATGRAMSATLRAPLCAGYRPGRNARESLPRPTTA